MSFPSKVKSGIIPIVTSATKLMSCYISISIFDLVTEGKRRSGYLVDGALIVRDMIFSPRGKSDISSIIVSATKLMSCPVLNLNI